MGPRALGALWLAAVVSHLPALANGLALDDAVILSNPALRSLRTLPALLASPWWFNTNQLYRPLTLVSFAVERAAAGGSVLLAHAVNVALHGLVTVLLARLLARLLPAPAAIAGALCFAVLPAHAEAVASVVGRAELLSALALVALMLLVPRERPPGRRERLLAFALGAAALACKEGGIAAPILAFGAAWLCLPQRPFAMRWALSTAAGSLALLLARLAVLGTMGGDLPNPVFRAMSAGERIPVALMILPRTAAMLVLPVTPAIDYVPASAQLSHPTPWLVAAGIAFVVLLAAMTLHHLVRPSAAGLGAWIVAATVAPTANLIFPSGVLLAGRTLYAPALGSACIVAALVAWLARRPDTGRAPAGRIGTLALLALAAFCAGMSWRESAVWRSTDTVIAEMQRRHPDDYRSYLHLGYMARDRGDDAAAVTHYRQAAERFAGDAEMLTDGATVALRLRDTTTARAWLAQAIVAKPRAVRARTRLAGVLIATHDTAGARVLLVDGLRRDPGQPTFTQMLRAIQD